MKLYKSDYIMQVIAHIVMGLLSVLALIPFVLLVEASFTDEKVAIMNGFSFFPEKWGLGAYRYLAGEWSQIGNAYLVTIVVTVVGTALGLAIATMLAYGLT